MKIAILLLGVSLTACAAKKPVAQPLQILGDRPVLGTIGPKSHQITYSRNVSMDNLKELAQTLYSELVTCKAQQDQKK